MRLVGSALIVLLSLGAAQAPPRSDPDRGTIAVLRRDGLMIPFASFRGTRWVSEWPVARTRGRSSTPLERPINLHSIPERWWGGWTPDAWQVVLKDGSTRELTPEAPRLFPAYCAESIGIRTDYRPTLTPPFPPISPYPKDGLAVTSGIRVDPIRSVSDKAPTWSTFPARLIEDFNRAEDREASLVSAVWSHPVKREDRHELPVQLESWYVSSVDDGVVSYIEAVRRYPPGPDDDECGLETLFGGWVIEREGERRPRADLRARITYCDRLGATYMQPFGRIRLRDRFYWIGEVSGQDLEWYTVAEMSGDRVRYVVEYPAGTSRSCR